METMKWLVLDGSGVLQPVSRTEVAVTPMALEVLQRVVEAVPDVRLVLSSTWRRDPRAWMQVVDQLQRAGLDLCDATPVRPTRAEEIAVFLAEQATLSLRQGRPAGSVGSARPSMAIHVAVLEDEEPMGRMESVTVRTAPHEGLRPSDLPRILAALQDPFFVLSGDGLALVEPVLASMRVGNGPELLLPPAAPVRPQASPAPSRSSPGLAPRARAPRELTPPPDRAAVLERRRERRGRKP